jgi:hypothetical protein
MAGKPHVSQSVARWSALSNYSNALLEDHVMSELQTPRFSPQSEYLYQILQDIQTRPGMYLGNCSITRLRAFLDGYGSARADLGLPETEQEKAFNGFQAWIQKRFNITAAQGWDRIILAHSTNEQEALTQFFELFQQFQQETLAIAQPSNKPINSSHSNSQVA